MLPQKHGVNLLSKLIKPLVNLNSKISSLFGSNVSAEFFIAAVCEELEFRWFVQEILLHQLPKKILEISAPDLAKKLETLPARISRVALAALILHSAIHKLLIVHKEEEYLNSWEACSMGVCMNLWTYPWLTASIYISYTIVYPCLRSHRIPTISLFFFSSSSTLFFQ